MKTFIFDSYEYDEAAKTAIFRYAFDDGRAFSERITFSQANDTYDREVFERTMFLAFVLLGASYYKAFPTREVVFKRGKLDQQQADFLNKVYQEGLSQYAFENSLTRDQLAHFQPSTAESLAAIPYEGTGVISMQSGGKDSILLAQLLRGVQVPFVSLYVSSTGKYPETIDRLGGDMAVVRRLIDHEALQQAKADGGLNGHVPVTYMVQSIALLQAILTGKSTVLAAIGHEGEEPHEWVGDLPVNHQWSKTWQAEQLLSDYVHQVISPDLLVGSPLRRYSELAVAEQFTKFAWDKFGTSFSSCNTANYQQGASNQTLTWCGHCPKCANSYLLFAPFVSSEELQSIFSGDLFARPNLVETFKGLLGIDGVMKPFECVGEIDELRYAYNLSQKQGGYAPLPFEVPQSSFDQAQLYPTQDFSDLIP